nr:transmembrane protein 202 isoform X3 [Vicugna pacos]
MRQLLYPEPTLPTNQHPSASMPPQRQQQHMDQTHTYIRMFCGSLCGFSLLMLICVSPLNWVQFLVIKNGLELYAGLWISCHDELCWSRTPKPPSSCLLLCLILFLAQVHWHTREAMESAFLWTYHLNWGSDFLYTFAGILSFLNYLTSRAPPLDQNVIAIPTEKSRLGIGPVTPAQPAEDAVSRSQTESTSERQENPPSAEL